MDLSSERYRNTIGRGTNGKEKPNPPSCLESQLDFTIKCSVLQPVVSIDYTFLQIYFECSLSLFEPTFRRKSF